MASAAGYEQECNTSSATSPKEHVLLYYGWHKFVVEVVKYHEYEVEVRACERKTYVGCEIDLLFDLFGQERDSDGDGYTVGGIEVPVGTIFLPI